MGEVVAIKKPRARKSRANKTALVLAGGGFVGGVYQIGALRALDMLGVSHTVNDFDIYVGTSAGAFVGALLANGCRPEDLMALLADEEVPGYEPLEVKRILQPNYRGILGRGIRMPLESATIAKDVLLNLRRLTIVDILTMVAELAPGGFYSLDGMTRMLSAQLGKDGFSNDFRALDRELYILATDLDSAEPIVFGGAGWDDVPISKAVAASAALPPVYQAVQVRGRDCVDGGLRGFANIEAAVENGAKLIIVINPIVPFVNERLRPYSGDTAPKVSEMGLANIMSQTFRMLVWSAMHERLALLQKVHSDVDVILIEPQKDDEIMFRTHILNLSQRVQIAKHGFESVAVQLGDDFDRYREVCARHGIEISRRKMIETINEAPPAESGIARWRRILERGAAGRR